MPSVDTILLVTLAGLALSASPGPSMLYVLSRSVGQSTVAGFASTIGLAIGGIVLAVASALGLAVVIKKSEVLYSGIKIAGALYLIYLGVQLIRESGKEDLRVYKVSRESFMKILYQGIWVEVLNPKTILFFLAFIPQFVDRSIDNITTQVLILGMLVPLTAVPSDIIVSVAGGTLADKLARKGRAATLLNWLGGLIMIGLGVRIFFLN